MLKKLPDHFKEDRHTQKMRYISGQPLSSGYPPPQDPSCSYFVEHFCIFFPLVGWFRGLDH